MLTSRPFTVMSFSSESPSPITYSMAGGLGWLSRAGQAEARAHQYPELAPITSCALSTETTVYETYEKALYNME
jgi:hypothetical protein